LDLLSYGTCGVCLCGFVVFFEDEEEDKCSEKAKKNGLNTKSPMA
jgi:hypothetical protein